MQRQHTDWVHAYPARIPQEKRQQPQALGEPGRQGKGLLTSQGASPLLGEPPSGDDRGSQFLSALLSMLSPLELDTVIILSSQGFHALPGPRQACSNSRTGI